MYANFIGSGQSLCPKPGQSRHGATDQTILVRDCEAWCTLQDCSWEEPGAPCCPAGPICLTRSGCFGSPFAKLMRRKWLHSRFNTKYNTLQRAAYFSVPVAGCLSVVTGGAIHKPMQFRWLAAPFGGFDAARVWHFWLMWVYIFFVVPHVILVFADGWDTLRSMTVGWSTRVKRSELTANE